MEKVKNHELMSESHTDQSCFSDLRNQCSKLGLWLQVVAFQTAPPSSSSSTELNCSLQHQWKGKKLALGDITASSPVSGQISGSGFRDAQQASYFVFVSK